MSERDEGFLARWSRRKIESRDTSRAPVEEPAAPNTTAPRDEAPPPPAGALPESAARELPALESLTAHSDFAPFMQAGVDPRVKGEALKTLFSDPALYPMDGLDVYIDDYAKPDPLPEGWLEKLNQLASLHGEPEAAAAPSTAPPAATNEAATEPGTAQDESSNAVPPPQDAGTDGSPRG